MQKLHLFRHGQAGSRDNYDTLSPLGIEQARQLGLYLARRGVRFDAAWMGGLRRQQQTARQVEQAYRESGVPFPKLEIDARWSEFHLYGVYKAIAPQLCRTDSQFRIKYEQMLEELKDPASDIHRRWTPCDEAVMRAWLSGRFEIDVETFVQFRARIEDALRFCCTTSAAGNVAVFTSATPIGLSIARALCLGNGKFMRLVETLYNSSWSVLRIHAGEPYLFSFNQIPHLIEPDMRTFR